MIMLRLRGQTNAVFTKHYTEQISHTDARYWILRIFIIIYCAAKRTAAYIVQIVDLKWATGLGALRHENNQAYN
jgi:hypothetical protein